MSGRYRLSDEELRLMYWQAVITFGKEAVECVVNRPMWIRKYPEIIRNAKSKDMRIKNDTLLPGEIVYEIAGQEECTHYFLAHPSGEKLYSAPKKRKQKELLAIDLKDYTKISSEEALLIYGAYCLFMAVDNIYGYKGESRS